MQHGCHKEILRGAFKVTPLGGGCHKYPQSTCHTWCKSWQPLGLLILERKLPDFTVLDLSKGSISGLHFMSLMTLERTQQQAASNWSKDALCIQNWDLKCNRVPLFLPCWTNLGVSLQHLPKSSDTCRELLMWATQQHHSTTEVAPILANPVFLTAIFFGRRFPVNWN